MTVGDVMAAVDGYEDERDRDLRQSLFSTIYIVNALGVNPPIRFVDELIPRKLDG